ncbi:MAG: helix-turn-helix domain-containing protein [Solirubrobacterales bacterium]|nr:helix-turn-helix domain-containing protein [Solirubrobacterales bacterium]
MTWRLLTARETADLLGVNPETVLRWVRRGTLPAIRLPSGQLRFREDALDRWLTERATPTRGDVTQPAGRHPAAIVIGVTQPEDEE